jgi:hypothetical protein
MQGWTSGSVEMDRFQKLLEREVTEGWMYTWFSELRSQEDWWKSTDHRDLNSDLSSVFSFRDSKIHLLKKIRSKLHQLQSCTVHLLV